VTLGCLAALLLPRAVPLRLGGGGCYLPGVYLPWSRAIRGKNIVRASVSAMSKSSRLKSVHAQLSLKSKRNDDALSGPT
jgi:hypothetical protein